MVKQKEVPFYRAQIIRRAMFEKEITVDSLVKLSGVSNVTIWRARTGQPIDMKKLRQIVEALDVSWAELFNFADDDKQQASAA